MIQWLIELLKRFLPPPVHAFNREVERILAAIGKQEDAAEQVRRENQLLKDTLGRQEMLLAQLGAALASQAVKLEVQEAALCAQKQLLLGQTAMLEDQEQQLVALMAGQKEYGLSLTGMTQQQEKLIQEQRKMIPMLEGVVQERVTPILHQLMQGQKNAGEERKNLLLGQRHVVADIRLSQVNQYIRTTPQPRLSYFVLNILDHCNLRCHGCDHFACIAEERFVAMEDICHDLKQMAKLTQGTVTRIGIMGGEPLLHPDLIQILQETRRWFPDTLIQLVSNGILLVQQSEEFWVTCHEYRISITVTKYPLNLRFDLMEELATQYDVLFEYYGKTGEIQKTSYKMPMDVMGRQDPLKSFWECYHANSLPLLMEGKFYPCTVAPNVRHFNKKFGTSMNLEEGDFLDIHAIEDIQELYRFLCTPKPFCRYCRTAERSFGHPWGRTEGKMEEWV